MRRADVQAFSGDGDFAIFKHDFGTGQGFTGLSLTDAGADADFLAKRQGAFVIDLQPGSDNLQAGHPDGCTHGFVQHGC